MADASSSRDSGPGTTRAFIAIELPPDVKDLIAANIERLKGLVPREVKWVDPRIAHLTLAFLGNVSDNHLPALSRIVDCVSGACPPFSIKTGPLGAFPNDRRPRVIWLGLEGNIRRLSAMHRCLQDGLESGSFPTEKRPFKPHVTLGRARGKGVIAIGDVALNLPGSSGLEFPVRELALMSSVLTPRGPIHTPLHRARLSSEGPQAPTHC